jgi:hypothetical protein
MDTATIALITSGLAAVISAAHWFIAQRNGGTTPPLPSLPTTSKPAPATPTANSVTLAAKINSLLQNFDAGSVEKALQPIERMLSMILPTQAVAVMNEVDQLLTLLAEAQAQQPATPTPATPAPAK